MNDPPEPPEEHVSMTSSAGNRLRSDHPQSSGALRHSRLA